MEFLHNVSTEAGLQQTQRKNGLLWTDYIFKALIKSLRLCLKQNSALATLELDGVPLYPEYFELLLKSISSNNSLRNLSLKHCLIGDSGCISLCKILRNKSNIELLNLSSCGLGPLSAKEIAKLINAHQNSRLIECWHNSLRYGDPELPESAATGLKRITLNNNPAIGDDGLSYIIEEFINESWIKALDMQRCGITENISEKLLSVLDQNTSLEIADFRFNDCLLPETLNRIFTILIQREPHSGPTYQWCESVSSKTTLASTNPLRSRSQTTTRPRSCSSRMSINSTVRDDCENTKELVILNDRLKEGMGRNKRLRSKNEELKEINRELEERWKKLQNKHPDLVEAVNKAIFDINFSTIQTSTANCVSQNTCNSKQPVLGKDRSMSGRSSVQTATDIMSEIGLNLPLDGISNSSNKSTEHTLIENSTSSSQRSESDDNEEKSEITEYRIADYGYLTSDDESNADEEDLNSPSSRYCDFESLMDKVQM